MTDPRDVPTERHLAWMARSFGRPDYLPLTTADLRTLDSVSEKVSMAPGRHLFREGEQATAAYLVERGLVDLYRSHGAQVRIVARVGSGSVIGDIAMFGEGTYLSSARAADQVQAHRFDRSRLVPELAAQPALCLRWLVAGLRQLEGAHRRIFQLMHKTVISQVADLLAEETSGSARVRLTQATIATLLGASRQSVNEALGELRRLGVVETGYGEISVVDPERLRAIADGRSVGGERS